MAAAWACALDFSPPKVTVVLDKIAKTRELVERSGVFVIQVPTVAQLQLTRDVGSVSLQEDPQKLAHSGVELFSISGHDAPFVAGCSAWLACKLLPEPHNQSTYDLLSVKSSMPGPTHGYSATAIGTMSVRTRIFVACTTSQAATFMRSAKR